MSRFTPENPKYTFEDTGKFRPVGLIVYRSDIIGQVVIASYFDTDGPSYPRWIRWYLDRLDKDVFDCSVVHDYCIRHRRLNDWTRKQCDQVFREAMQDKGVDKFDCTLIYNSVRLWAKWKRYDG